MGTKKVSIVIPNYNGRKLLEKNLKNVINSAQKYASDTEILLVDDYSNDNSCEYVENNFPSIVLIRQTKNQGFSTSCNTGVKQAKGDIVVLLNTDVSPEENFLVPLVSNFDDENVFAVGCLDESQEKDKVVERGRGIGKFIRGFLIHKKGQTDKKSTLWAAGGSSAFDKNKWLFLSGLDENYNPFYWEDIDLSYRAQKYGWRVLFEQKSVVYHNHQEGAIKNSYTKLRVKEIAYRNQLIFMWKNITDTKIMFSHLLWLPIHLANAFLRGDISFILGFFQALLKIPIIIKYRIKVIGADLKQDKDIVKEYAAEFG